VGDPIKQNIIDYYQSSQWIYKYFCYNSSSLGMHFGFWDKNTRNRQEAIENENDLLIVLAGIKKDMKVLDAGCGVGGTALQIAEKTGAKVWGITITPLQVVLANKYAKQKSLETFVTFSVQDYTKTDFPSNFFDVIIGIESICYASPKRMFLDEAFRILKPGGKLIIADGYLKRQPENAKEKKIIKDFMWAFALLEFISENEMQKQIKRSGFTQVKSKNMFQEIKPSVAYFSRLGKQTNILCETSKYIPNKYVHAIYKNYLATKMSAEGYNKGLADYYIHLGVKPK
jgi:tocopherol O-methyltransferase